MTYNVELTAKPDKRGLHHVMIRLHSKGTKPARVQTEIELESKHWNKRRTWNKWVRSSHQHADAVNADISSAYTKIKTTVQSYLEANPSLTPKQCKERYEAGSVTVIKSQLANIRFTELSQSTNEARQYVWQAFLRWAGEELAIEQITPALIDKYKKQLLVDGKQSSTINEYMASLRIMYETVQKRRGISRREILANSPFLEWETLVVNRRPKARLNEEKVLQLAAAPYTFYRKGTYRGNPGRTFYNWADWGRWCWLACHWQAGMRIGDLIRSRYEWYEVDAEGYPIRLRYKMQKNGRPINIPLSLRIRQHLNLIWEPGLPGETYLTPFLDAKDPYYKYRSYEQIRAMPTALAERFNNRISSVETLLNRGLKKVVKELGIELPDTRLLTNHTARHSFADKIRRAIKEGKTDNKGRPVTHFDAKELLGHADLRTTEGYFGDMDQDWLDSAMDAIDGDK